MELKEFNEKYNVMEELKVVNIYEVELSDDIENLKEHEINSDLVNTDYEINEESRYFIYKNDDHMNVASDLSFDELKRVIKEL